MSMSLLNVLSGEALIFADSLVRPFMVIWARPKQGVPQMFESLIWSVVK